MPALLEVRLCLHRSVHSCAVPVFISGLDLHMSPEALLCVSLCCSTAQELSICPLSYRFRGQFQAQGCVCITSSKLNDVVTSPVVEARQRISKAMIYHCCPSWFDWRSAARHCSSTRGDAHHPQPGTNTDLSLTFKVSESSNFSREGADFAPSKSCM